MLGLLSYLDIACRLYVWGFQDPKIILLCWTKVKDRKSSGAQSLFKDPLTSA